MIARLTGAASRGLLVAFLVAAPSLILPTVPTETAQVVAFVAIACMILTTIEYGSSSPCLFEFRDAGPFNRIRYGAGLLTVVLVSLVARHDIAPTGLTAFITSIGHVAGGLLDFPYSPLRIALPAVERPETFHAARSSLGVAILVFGGFFAVFAAELHRGRWPSSGMFNVWVNLPTFDPTRGGDVVARLDRDGKFNVVLGCILPLLFPLILGTEGGALGAQPQAMVWTVAFWIGLPFSLFMRGLAMQKIASMIEIRRSDSTAPRAGLVAL
ncbi:hypothetical protein SAMN04488020_104307 [Palleronia marisminoris]|uniref:Uncharacterized protein n=1 Tax=Palleronia marisminoris TaxID=315423 RepID=A0A1Y5SPM9_9RHOB|nr:hypothetical protein [Palleronia marisminoris]SFG89022.1 hypothetical protein SAMN04488020_104307 [Palleronia marisminoris]SLN43761.1 hypothetical protein PAM7066_01930 [Palleronia marisminoris]